MDASIFEQFIVPIALVAAFVVGYVVKNAVPNETVNRFIPLICAVVGAVVCCWAEYSITAMTVVTGLVSGLGATGLYEGFKQIAIASSGEDTAEKQSDDI